MKQYPEYFEDLKKELKLLEWAMAESDHKLADYLLGKLIVSAALTKATLPNAAGGSPR